jgi:chemotaxis signal transduction protein
VLGLFSLRGTPVAVVDLLVVLRKAGPPVPAGGELQVLVLRTAEGVVAGLRIDRLEAVVPSGKGQPVLTEGTEHPAIIGLYEREPGQTPSILLGGDRLLDSLMQTGFANTAKF